MPTIPWNDIQRSNRVSWHWWSSITCQWKYRYVYKGKLYFSALTVIVFLYINHISAHKDKIIAWFICYQRRKTTHVINAVHKFISMKLIVLVFIFLKRDADVKLIRSILKRIASQDTIIENIQCPHVVWIKTVYKNFAYNT